MYKPTSQHRDPNCSFCNEGQLEPHVIAETRSFYVAAHPSPLCEAHLLILPRVHLPCLAAMPETLEAEFLKLKAEVGQFLEHQYGRPTFFEFAHPAEGTHHAHLHTFPTRAGLQAPLAPGPIPIRTFAELRRWYRDLGRYVYYEEDNRGSIWPSESTTVFDKLHLERMAQPSVESAGPELAAGLIRERWCRYQAALGNGTVDVVTCFLWRRGRICLFKRSERVGSARGKWHGVSGYLPTGTDPLDHAMAEVQQETGLGPDQVLLLKKGRPLVLQDPVRGTVWRIHPFLFEVLAGEPGLNWEHVELAWVRPEDLSRYDCVPWLQALYLSLDP